MRFRSHGQKEFFGLVIVVLSIYGAWCAVRDLLVPALEHVAAIVQGMSFEQRSWMGVFVLVLIMVWVLTRKTKQNEG